MLPPRAPCPSGLTLSWAFGCRYDLIDLSAEDFSFGGGVSRLVRVTVHVETGGVDWTSLIADPDLNLEFPVISSKGVGQSCGFTYMPYSNVR